MAGRPLIVGIGGTLRPGSTSERALALTLARAQSLGAETRIFAGPALHMPLYDTAVLARHGEAHDLVEALRMADGIIISSPGYHGSISGLLKNALDYAEDLRTDVRPYFTGRAVGLIACADGVQAMGSTLATLRAIVHALRGWPTPYAAMVSAAPRPLRSGRNGQECHGRWQSGDGGRSGHVVRAPDGCRDCGARSRCGARLVRVDGC